jgi:hypothetical protein
VRLISPRCLVHGRVHVVVPPTHALGEVG